MQVRSPAGHCLGETGVMVDADRQVRIGDPAPIIREEIGEPDRGRVTTALEHVQVQGQVARDT